MAFLLESHPPIHDPGQAFLAVADDKHIHERREHFGILSAWPPGDYQRFVERAVLAEE